MARRRKLDVFGLSFLDAMTCGFGAVVLFFMVIQGATDDPIPPQPESSVHQRSEVDLLEEEVLDSHEQWVELRNARQAVERRRVEAQGLSRRLIETLQEIQRELATHEQQSLAKTEHLNQLQTDLRNLEQDTKRLSASLPDEQAPGDRTRAFVGDGDRQYLTGLKVGGERILILVDSSASMLADTLVNVIVRRNLSESKRRRSPKWRQAVATVDWLVTQMPAQSHFQLYRFAETARPMVAGSHGKWLDTGDRKVLEEAVTALRRTAPAGGTNLHQALATIHALKPRPDNVILLVDGLPTQGRKPSKKGTITGKARLKLFGEALEQLPRGIPVNVILFPMEGDPMAASAYWHLALRARGSFLAPAEDWP